MSIDRNGSAHQPAGTPTGGQFAEVSKSEAPETVKLTSPVELSEVDTISQAVLELYPDAQFWSVESEEYDNGWFLEGDVYVHLSDGMTVLTIPEADLDVSGLVDELDVGENGYRQDLRAFKAGHLRTASDADRLEPQRSDDEWRADLKAQIKAAYPVLATIHINTELYDNGYFYAEEGFGFELNGEGMPVDLSEFADLLTEGQSTHPHGLGATTTLVLGLR